MKNFVQAGNVLSHIAAADVLSGKAVVLTDRVGIATTNALETQPVEVLVEGVVEYDKITTAEFTIGQKLYYDAGDDKVTDDPDGGDNKPIGWAAAPALEAAPVCKIKLGGF